MSFAWIAQAVTQITVFGDGMMMPGVLETFGLSIGELGQIGLVGGLAGVIMTIPITLIASKAHKRHFMTIIIVALGASMLIYGTAQGLAGLYISKTIRGLLGQAIAAALVLVKIGSVPQDEMQKVNGVENFVGPVGQIIGTMFMAQMLALLNGWRNVYIVMGIVLLLCVVGWFITYGKGKMMVYDTPKEEVLETKTNPMEGLKIAAKKKEVWLVALSWPFTTLIWLAMFTYWPTYATTDLGLDLLQVGLILAMIPIFSAIASLTSPLLANKIGKDKPLIWPWGFILPIVYFSMLQTNNVVILSILAAIAGFGAYCFVPLAMTIIYKIGLPSDAVSAGVGIVLTCIALGTTAGGGLVGILGGQFGLYNAMAISCLAPIVFGVLTLMLPELGRKKMEEYAKQNKL